MNQPLAKRQPKLTKPTAMKILRYEDILLLKPPRHGESLAMCVIESDALKDAGILKNDYLVYRWSANAATGDVVVVETTFGVTVKLFDPTMDGAWLRCANAEHEDRFYWNDDFLIRGVGQEIKRVL